MKSAPRAKGRSFFFIFFQIFQMFFPISLIAPSLKNEAHAVAGSARAALPIA
jgi:hypothetical protein